MYEKTFPSAFQWNLYGAEGRAVFQGSFHRRWRTRLKDDLIVAEIGISALWPDRTNEAISFHKMLKDFSVTLHQVNLSLERVTKFSEAVSGWSEQSSSIEQNLCRDKGDQKLLIFIGSPDPHKSLSKTVVIIRYSSIVFDIAEWSFAIDQSCIKIFADELKAALAESQTSGGPEAG